MTWPRTDPTAAAAMPTATIVEVTHAMTRRDVRFMTVIVLRISGCLANGWISDGQHSDMGEPWSAHLGIVIIPWHPY